jgi:hypothetical protein
MVENGSSGEKGASRRQYRLLNFCYIVGFSEEIRFKKNGMPLSIVTESKVIDLWVHGSCGRQANPEGSPKNQKSPLRDGVNF